jgi:hypothetical protein
MKPSPIHLLSVILISVVLIFASPVFGDDTTDMLSKSLDLVHQVENPKGNPPTDAQRIDLLTQVITMAQEAPNHRLKGHRVLAIQAIRSAIAEIRGGDPNHQAAIYLHTADTELSTSVSLANTADTVDSKTTNPTSTMNTTAATPPASISTDPASLETAARAGDLEKVKALLQANPNLVFSTGDGEFTPLVAAAWSDHKDVVEFLLANHADINAQDSLHMTALSHAATESHKEMAEFLLANKADPNIGDNSGLTPLFQASLMGRKEMVELLLAHGADVNAKGKDGSFWAGDTPLYIAACNGSAEVAKVLLAHGADVNAKGHDGLTPLEIAVKNHHDTAEVPENDVADLLRPPAKESPGNSAASVPPEVTPEMEQAFLTKYKAALEKQDLDAYVALVANDPHMDSKAKESLKGTFLFGAALTVSNPDRAYSFVPLPSGQKDEPTQLNGKMYDAYLPAVVGLKITFGKPVHPSSTEPMATGDTTLPLCIQDHELMMIGLKEIPGAVPPPAVDKAANFGIEPNLRKLSDKGKWEDRDAFTSLDEFLFSLKQPALQILDSGESAYEYYAICRIAPNLCVWAGGDKVGERNYTFYFKATDSNKQELNGSPQWIRLVDVPTDNGQAPNVQGTVFFVPDHYSGPVTVEANYSDESGKKALSFSRTVDWKQ